MSEIIKLIASIRQELGTGPARALRKQGMVPAIIYGNGQKPLAIAIIEKDITKLYRKPSFTSTVIQLVIGEQQHNVLPKAIELHPVTDLVRHVDFVNLSLKSQKVAIPIVYEGKERALGVKRGGFFNIVKRTILMICPADNIPKKIVIDVINMYVGQSIRAADLLLPVGCQIVNYQANHIIASIIGSRSGKADGSSGEENSAAAT